MWRVIASAGRGLLAAAILEGTRFKLIKGKAKIQLRRKWSATH